VKSLIAASALVLLPLIVAPAHAQLVACETFDRSSAHAAQFVRDYLDRSKGLFVRVCGSGDHPQYYGASSITRDGDICRYSEYELNLSRTNPPRLERTTTPPQTYMRVSESTCPSPASINYAATNNVPQDVFEHLVHVWRDAISSPASFDGTLSGIPDAAVLHRLRNTVLQGKGNRLVVLNVAQHRDLGLWKSYEVEVADPDHSDRFYAVIVSSWFGRTYEISGVRAGIY